MSSQSKLNVDCQCRFKKQFASYLADDIGSEDIEEMYTNGYAAIRESPGFEPTEKEKDWKEESLKHKVIRRTHEERKKAIQEKITAFKAGDGGAGGDDDDDE